MFEMEDLPMKPAPTPKPTVRNPRTVRKPQTARQTTAKATRKQTARVGNHPVKKLPPMKAPGEQPRDNLGRFARKTGAVLWGAAKGTVKAVKGTAKGIKRVQSDMRRRARLEERERRIVLAEREKKLGLRKKVVRRKRKKA